MVIKGTTPTIKYTYSTVDVSKITKATMTIKQDNTTICKRDLESAEIGDKYLQWTLTQAETLAINEHMNIQVQCKYKLEDGTVGASEITNTSPYDILDEEVM